MAGPKTRIPQGALRLTSRIYVDGFLRSVRSHRAVLSDRNPSQHGARAADTGIRQPSRGTRPAGLHGIWCARGQRARLRAWSVPTGGVRGCSGLRAGGESSCEYPARLPERALTVLDVLAQHGQRSSDRSGEAVPATTARPASGGAPVRPAWLLRASGRSRCGPGGAGCRRFRC